MIAGIRTLDDIEVSGKTVLLRIDINSPLDSAKKIKDDTRIKRSLPTIKELSDKGAKTVILAHQADPLDYHNFTCLAEHARILEGLLKKPIKYIDDVVGPAARQAIMGLENGQILLLENIRIHTEETIIFEKELKLSPREQAQTILVRKLAPLADIYLCDAFACVHRSQPSLVGFTEVLPCGCGRLFEEELSVLTRVMKDPQRPCLFILGGAKILDAFGMMEKVLANGSADRMLTCGLVGEIMLKANGYDLGAPTEALIRDKNLEKFVEPAKRILDGFRDKVLYPVDVAVELEGRRQNLDIPSLPVRGLIKDIGARAINQYSRLISESGTVFMNGPAGVYEDENFSLGTKTLWQEVAGADAFSVIGGGDTIAAAKRFKVDKKISYVCTAGGGLVLFLAGKKLAVIEALKSR